MCHLGVACTAAPKHASTCWQPSGCRRGPGYAGVPVVVATPASTEHQRPLLWLSGAAAAESAGIALLALEAHTTSTITCKIRILHRSTGACLYAYAYASTSFTLEKNVGETRSIRHLLFIYHLFLHDFYHTRKRYREDLFHLAFSSRRSPICSTQPLMSS